MRVCVRVSVSWYTCVCVGSVQQAVLCLVTEFDLLLQRLL